MWILCVAIFLFIVVGQILFNTMIIIRGISKLIAPFAVLVDSFASNLKAFLNSDFMIQYILFPYKYIYSVLANVQFNLDAVNVTCEGSKAPIRLLLNICLLGFALIVIDSDYTTLCDLSVTALSETFLVNY